MDQDRGVIFKFKKYAIHDGPGIRTSVFLKGCPLSCWWCHNPESQAMTTETMGRTSSAVGEIVGKTMTVGEVIREVEKDTIFYDESGGGVTFSGGEPLMQAGFLKNLLRACREREIHTALDTTGFGSTESFMEVADLTDLILFDLKIMDPEMHIHFTGVSNELIFKNLRELSLRGGNIILRFPLIPGITDGRENIEAMADFMASLPLVNEINILPYHRTGEEKYRRLGMENRMAGVEICEEGRVIEVEQFFKSRGFIVKRGG